MSATKPIVPCPLEQRPRVRKALFLRLHDAFEELRACEHAAREVEDHPLAESIKGAVCAAATALSDFEKTIRKELGA